MFSLLKGKAVFKFTDDMMKSVLYVFLKVRQEKYLSQFILVSIEVVTDFLFKWLALVFKDTCGHDLRLDNNIFVSTLFVERQKIHRVEGNNFKLQEFSKLQYIQKFILRI